MNNEAPQQAQPAGLNWFTQPEIKAAIDAMEFNEQKELLLALTGSRTWVAILKYLKDRREVALSGLAVYDPVKEPTMIARCQGIMSGIMDLPEVLGQVVMEAKDKEKEAEKATETQS
jgi:hypothetical protein